MGQMSSDTHIVQPVVAYNKPLDIVTEMRNRHDIEGTRSEATIDKWQNYNKYSNSMNDNSNEQVNK
jgi:hypothetical protein